MAEILHTAMTFVSNTAYENGIYRQLNLKRMVRPVKNIRNLSKADMKNNNATPKLDDPQTYEVFVDGEKSPVRRQQNYPYSKILLILGGMHK